jgi:hypothetical protein
MAANYIEDDDEWVYPHHHKNQQYIVELMSYHHGRWDAPYDRDQVFSKEHLLALKTHHIVEYINLKAFENPFPGPRDQPIHARAGSLKKAKQALSWFMPHKGVPWMTGRGGNPTRHSTVNNATTPSRRLNGKTPSRRLNGWRLKVLEWSPMTRGHTATQKSS